MAWAAQVIKADEVAGRAVLEVGAYNVNGSVRPIFEQYGPARYLGTDMQAGPGVDQVVDCTELASTFDAGSWDVVACFEMLEHAADWKGCLLAMAAVLKPGGLLVVTTRSPGFKYHGFPDDHWRFTLPLLGKALVAVGCGSHELRADPDPASPGVFATARKSVPWRPNLRGLARLEAEPAPPKR